MNAFVVVVVDVTVVTKVVVDVSILLLKSIPRTSLALTFSTADFAVFKAKSPSYEGASSLAAESLKNLN